MIIEMKVSGDFSLDRAEKLVRALARVKSKTSIIASDKRIDAKSIMGVLSLSLRSGDDIIFAASGADETDALELAKKYI